MNGHGFGIVVFDLGDGDACHRFVDGEKWAQILEVHKAVDDEAADWRERLSETVGWLTTDDMEVPRPEGAPEFRKGRVLASYFTQRYVVESADLDPRGPLLGIITFP